LLVTFDPTHAGKAKEEVDKILEEVKEKAEYLKSEVDGLFQLKVKDAKKLVKNLVDFCKKNKKKFEQVVKEKNEAIRRKQKEITSLPEGMAFFVEEELRETICKEMDKELNKFVKAFFESFKKYAAASVKGKILSKDLTGRPGPMVLNAIYLIAEEKVGDFKKEAEELNRKILAERFYLEYSGPWPPYSFVSY